MAGGWGNPLMRKEDEFLALDGTYVTAPTPFLIISPNELQDDRLGRACIHPRAPRILPTDDSHGELETSDCPMIRYCIYNDRINTPMSP